MSNSNPKPETGSVLPAEHDNERVRRHTNTSPDADEDLERGYPSAYERHRGHQRERSSQRSKHSRGLSDMEPYYPDQHREYSTREPRHWRSWQTSDPQTWSSRQQPITINLTLGGGGGGGLDPSSISQANFPINRAIQARQDPAWVDEVERSKLRSLFPRPGKQQHHHMLDGDDGLPLTSSTEKAGRMHASKSSQSESIGTALGYPTAADEKAPAAPAEEELPWIYEPVEGGFWKVVQNFDFKIWGSVSLFPSHMSVCLRFLLLTLVSFLLLPRPWELESVSIRFSVPSLLLAF